jgi:D-alanyl-D-alanine carboxypeptidase
MTTKADLEEMVESLEQQLHTALTQRHVLDNESIRLRADSNIQEKHITCLNANRDHVRHALEAFAAAECPNLDLVKPRPPVLPAAIMQAMGVQAVAPAARPPHMAGRDIVADMLEHLHKLVR